MVENSEVVSRDSPDPTDNFTSLKYIVDLVHNFDKSSQKLRLEELINKKL